MTSTIEPMSLSILNPRPKRLHGPALLHGLVQESTPTRLAIEYWPGSGDSTTLSYDELHRGADTLARRIANVLDSEHFDPDERLVIPVLIPQCTTLYVALVAILKVGGAFCPLNLDAPPERVKFILKDVAAKVIVTNKELASRIPEGYPRRSLIFVEDSWHDGISRTATSCVRVPKPADLAYVMYTSGSTGTPKGVGISHDAVTQSLLSHDRHIPRFARFLQFAAPTFDVSVFEIFFPLLRGATLVSCSRAEMLNDLPAVLRKMNVDACELTPTVAGSLLRTRRNAPALRLLLTIGEMLTEPVVKEFGGSEERSSMLWAMYGPTEATIHCTLQASVQSHSAVGVIGSPLDTVSAFIVRIPKEGCVKEDLQIAPVGEVGELAVGGYQLATEYINNPEQTESVFVQGPHGRLYLTGDRARMMENGKIECLGRVGEGQVKVRGQRIEVGEVEQAALRAGACHGAAAVVIASTLVIFAVADGNATEAELEILESCQAWLPGFMVPGDIVVMRDLPRLPSGKVDRKRLKADYESSKATNIGQPHEYIDHLEGQLCDVARHVRGVEFRPSTNLAAAGVDSLIAIRYASALRQTGIAVGALDVLGSGTIRQLHRLIQQSPSPCLQETNATSTINVPLQVAVSACPALGKFSHDIDTVVYCTPTQKAMLAETSTDSRAYCNWVELEFPQQCNVDLITMWFLELAQSNEALRSGFAHVDGNFVRIVWSHLPDEQILLVDDFSRDFCMASEASYLRPLTIQVQNRPCHGTTKVVLQFHHALYDGWTMDMLLTDLNTLALAGTVLSRPSFRSVTEYYCSAAFHHDSDRAREYWAEHLLSSQQLPFPKLLCSVDVGTRIQSITEQFDVAPAQVTSVAQLLTCSPQALFQAAVIWLWSSIVGSDEVVIGTVTSGRTIPVPGIENIMGPCIATIPLRSNISQSRLISDLIQSIHLLNRASLRHCMLPLGEIKKAAGLFAGQALYDVLFVYQESLDSAQHNGGLVKVAARQDQLETKILIEVEPTNDNFSCRITFHSNVLHEDHAALLVQQLRMVLQSFMAGPKDELPCIQSCFSDKLLSVYNSKASALAGTPDLARMVEATVARSPDRPAVHFAHRISSSTVQSDILTYGELNTLANQLARRLQAQGIKEGDVVAIVMDKSAWLYTGILGILKAGCAYLPLLPTTPRPRLGFILRQSKATACLTEHGLSATLHDLNVCRVLDFQRPDVSEYSADNISLPIDSSRIANIIYTSGSTGAPKGVCVTQLNIISNLDVLSRLYPVGESPRLLQSCSQAFDVSVFEIFFAWKMGMCLCSASNDTLFEDLERAIRMLNVTHLSMTPTVAALVDPSNVPNVEFLVTSGEAMTEKVARMWIGKLYQGYGPSETTNICTVKKMAPGDEIRHLGWSFDNTSVIVLSPGRLEAVPLGCLGELCFGGDQVAQGYLEMPELTASKFIEHPKYGRLYRSGDLGRMLHDGSLIIQGRIDDQIKLRGQRVELGEIDTILLTSAEVKACATLLIRRGGKADQLASFYVPTRAHDNAPFNVLFGEPADQTSLFRILHSRLPTYTMPSYLIPISVIPLTASGKVDRSRLVEAFDQLSSELLEVASHPENTERADETHFTNLERCIARSLHQALDSTHQSVGRWTPFANLGLDSISAITVARQLQRDLKQRVPVSLVLRNPCIARLASALSIGEETTGSKDDALNVFSDDFQQQLHQAFSKKAMEIEDFLPCTPLQEGMLVSSSDRMSYYNRILLRLHCSVERMRVYWDIMCRRHGILRTCFVTTRDLHHAIAQVVLKRTRFQLHEFRNSTQTVDQYVQRHMDLVPDALDSFQPPFSLATFTRKGETFLSFICHHALYDGVAVRRLLYEIEQLVACRELPDPPAYRDFLQEALALTEPTDKFWKTHLGGFRPKRLPKSPDRLLRQGRRVHTFGQDITAETIGESVRKSGSSLLSICQASWAMVISIMQEDQDVCFGNVMSGRSIPVDRVDELVASCFNTIPVRVDISQAASSSDIIKVLQSLNPQILQYQFTPLRRIQSTVVQNGQRLFDTLLLLQQAPISLDSNVWELVRDDGDMDLPLICEIIPMSNNKSLEIKLHYDNSHLSEHAISFISELFSHALTTFLKYGNSHVQSRQTLPEDLKRKLLKLDLRHSVEQEGTMLSCDSTVSDLEARIRSCFSKLSGTPEERITRNTTIYQMGLDSISAVQIPPMLRNQGINVTAIDVIEHPTCAKLAEYLRKNKVIDVHIPQYDIDGFREEIHNQKPNGHRLRNAGEDILPCTPLQLGMLTEFIRSRGESYLNFMEYDADSRVSVEALEEAWVVVTKHHSMLRMGFVPVEHPHCTFAMVPWTGPPPIAIGYPEEVVIERWKEDTRRHALEHLDEPPWWILLLHDQDHVSMHLAIHHALYDARSLQLILRDVALALQGQQLPPSPRLNDVLGNLLGQIHASSTSAKSFWQGQAPTAVINSFPVMTPLRAEERNALVQSMSSRISFSSLQRSLRQSNASVHVVAQAAWTRLLSAYLGEAVVLFGVVLSGRNTEHTEDAVFPCITTLPVIATNKSSNAELLDDMMRHTTEVHRHQHTPLTHTQRWLGHPNERLFDTLLVYQHHPQSSEQPWTIVDDETHIDYPVSLEIEPQDHDVLQLRLTFYDDILPPQQARLLMRQFDAIFCDLAEHPRSHENNLVVKNPELFSTIPAKEPWLPSKVNMLHDFLESSAREYPSRIALKFVSRFEADKPISRQWTYAGLDEVGNRVANMLTRFTQPGQIVAICFDKCPEAFFSILGILKAGCAFVALDPSAPPSRKRFILQDSGSPVLLLPKRAIETLDFNPPVIIIGVDDDELAQYSTRPIDLKGRITPENTCYCLYTSGTTGTPKGCEITHENAVQALLAFQRLFEGTWDAESKWLQFAAFHFDVSVMEQYWSWSVGITMISAPRDVILEDLAGTISKLDITHIDLTPSLARILHPDDVPSLCKGLFITGGEQLKQEILDLWGDQGVIYNAYGPTEATIGVTMYQRVPRNGRPSNIGTQFPNVGSYVFRKDTEILVLRGGVGELCVSGKLVGKGYLNRNDLTAESFISLRNGERVYRTGDLVRVLHDGSFDFLGRAGDQVKLRGQRLEVQEINHVIRSKVGEVIDVVTLVVNVKEKDFLASFIVTRDSSRHCGGLQADTSSTAVAVSRSVQDACRSSLPGYMVPTYVVVIPFVPLSPNNKAEVKKLKALFGALNQETLTPVSSSSKELDASSRKLIEILRTTEEVGGLGISGSTNIFDLGIDSVSVLRFTRTLKREGFANVTASLIMQNPTVELLAKALSQIYTTAGEGAVLEAQQLVRACHHKNRPLICRTLNVTAGEIEYIAPCSPLQQGILSRSAASDLGAYFNTFTFALAEGISLERLKLAWITTVEQNAILRTRFILTTDGYIQVALRSPAIVWKDISLDSSEEENLVIRSRDEWIALNTEVILQPLQFTILRSGSKQTLMINMFHGIYDGISFELIINNVLREYHGLTNAMRPSFYEALLYGPLRSHASCRPFWEEHLRNFAYEPMPQLTGNTSTEPLSAIRRVSFNILEATRRRLNVTHQSLVQAVWLSVLHRVYSGRVCLGIVVSGRSMELNNADRVIGPLFNTLPYYSTRILGETWSSLARKCHDFNVATLAFQHVPLRDIQKWCSRGEHLFETLFAFQRESADHHDEMAVWTRVNSGLNPDYPLNFEAILSPDGGLQLCLVAQAGIADNNALSQLLDQFELATSAIASAPDTLILSSTHGQHAINTPAKSRSVPKSPRPPITNDHFQWTPETTHMKQEISTLAQCNPDHIDEHTSILEVGLDSIDLIRLSARLSKIGLKVTVSQLMKSQTISNTARMIHADSSKPGQGGFIRRAMKHSDLSEQLKEYLAHTSVDLSGVEAVLPTTPLQDSLVAEMIQSNYQRYFNHDVLELSHDVDIERLKGAWEMVFKKSPILRTSFVPIEAPQIDSAYCQLIRSGRELKLPCHELQSLELVEGVIDEARQIARNDTSGLFQVAFIKVNEKHYLVLSMAHALYDGWSLEILHQDIQAAYDGNYWQRNFYQDYLCHVLQSSGSDAKQFWRDYLEGSAPTHVSSRELITDGGITHRAKRNSIVSCSARQDYCRSRAVSMQVLGQAAWAAVLAQLTQSLDVIFGVVLLGRETQSAEELLFPTMNTVPIRSILHGTGASLLQYMQQNMANINEFQHFPLRKAQALANIGPKGLFNTLFIQQRSVTHKNESEAPQLMKSVKSASAVEYPVCVEMQVNGDSLVWRVACDASYFSEAGVQHLLGSLDAVLGFLVSAPEADVLRFSGSDVSVCGLPFFSCGIGLPLVAPGAVTDGHEENDAWNDVEETIRRVLSDVSQTPLNHIRRSYTLYHLGLDSISAIKVSSLLQKKGLNIAVRDMVEADSIEHMAVHAKLRSDEVPSEDLSQNTLSSALQGIDVDTLLESANIDKSSLEAVWPATPLQVHMISAWQNSGGAVFYPEFRFRLSGVADRRTISDAWAHLVAENPILQTGFLATSSRKVPFLQLVGRNGVQDSRAMVSLSVLTAGHDAWLLRLKIHHALYDGVSLPALMERFTNLVKKSGPRADDGTAKWKRFVASHFGAEALASRREFWTSYLKGCEIRQMKAPDGDSSPDSMSRTRVSHFQPAALRNLGNVKAICSSRGLSLQSIFFAAYSKILAISSGGKQTNVIVGVYLANRTLLHGLEEIPFPTLNLVPLRVRDAGSRDILDVAAGIQQDLHKISSLENATVGLWEIKEWTGLVLDSFVNFLSLPFAEDSGEGKEDVMLEEVRDIQEQQQAEQPASGESTSVAEETRTWIASNLVRDAYPDAIDIEAAVNGDGLDIGVFSSKTRWGDRAKGIVAEIVGVLENL